MKKKIARLSRFQKNADNQHEVDPSYQRQQDELAIQQLAKNIPVVHLDTSEKIKNWLKDD